MEDVIQLLDRLEDLVEESRGVLFSNSVMVDKEQLINLITEIRLKLPNEITNSKYIMEERDKILVQARREAEMIVRDTEGRMDRLVDEHQVIKLAHDKAQEIIEQAKLDAREMRLGAREYIDEILSTAEDQLKQSVESVHMHTIQFEQQLGEVIQVIQNNRRELRVKKNK